MTRNRMSNPDLVTTGFCIVGGAAVVVFGVMLAMWATREPKPVRLTDEQFARLHAAPQHRMQRGGIERR